MPDKPAHFDHAALWQAADPWSSIPPHYNLGVALTRGNVDAGRGEKVCLSWENSAGQSRRFTYQQLDEMTNRLASSLVGLGVQAGDRVLLRLPNVPEFYIAALAIAKLGGVFIPTSTQFREAEIEYRLNDSGAVAVITTTSLVDVVEAVRNRAPELEHVICSRQADDAELADGQFDFWQLTADGGAGFVAVETAHDDLAFIAYTSGTTGDPKGVVHYQRYPIAYESLIRYWHDYHEDDVCSCPAEVGWLLPVASTFLYALRSGLHVVLYHPLDGRFDAAAWFRLIEKYRITNFVGTPTIYRMLVNHADVDSARLESLRHGVSAGEPLPPDTLEAVRTKLGIVPLDGIGMSECMVYCFNHVGDALMPGSCGRPAPGCVIRLLDDELREVPTGSEGVLCVRRDTHPGMMREYWNKPERTAEVFRGDWYVSGDVLTQDENGRFWFKGRSDDVIKASGYRISPFEVESTLAEHPAVLESAAVASPDEVRGSVIKAFIVLRDGFAASGELAAEIQAWVKQRAAGYKYPRKVEFVVELPKTPSGKIKRGLLRAAEFGES